MDYINFEKNLEKLKNELDKVNGDARLLSSDIIDFIKNFVNTNKDFYDQINALIQIGITNEERELIVNKMLEKKLQSINDKKELISKLFSLNIENIKDINLPNGKNIFVINTGNEPIAIENSSDLSMVELIKKIQTENSKFQTNDAEKNASNIIENIGYENKRLLKTIYIDDIYENEVLIRQLPEEQYQSFNKLVNDMSKKNETLPDEDKILYFNIENQFAVAKNGKVYDVKTIRENGVDKIVAGSSIENKYNNEIVESIKTIEVENENLTSDNIEANNNIKTSESTDGIINEDEVEINYDPNEDEIKPEDLFGNDETYRNMTDEEKKELLDKIKKVARGEIEAENQYIEDYAELYKKKIDEKKFTSPSKTNKLIYKSKNSGFINVVFITTIILCLLVIILFAMLN